MTAARVMTNNHKHSHQLQAQDRYLFRTASLLLII